MGSLGFGPWPSIGSMGAPMEGHALKPLNTIECCDMQRVEGGPSIGAPMMARDASL